MEDQCEVNRDKFEVARPGDSILVPFQCDLYVFRCLRQQEHSKISLSDKTLLLKYSRRADLDMPSS